MMDSSMDMHNQKTESPLKKIQETGSISKKKKERENRISVSSNDLAFDWSQVDMHVTVSVVVGTGHDERNVKVIAEDQDLNVSLQDGRKFRAKLYERVVSDCTEITFKGSKCIIKLLKYDPNIFWKSLEYSRNLQQETSALKQKNSKCFPSIPTNDGMEIEDSNKINNVKEAHPKINFVERQGDPTLTIYLYVSNIKKESLSVNISPDIVTVQFSCNDASFLKTHPDYSPDDTFEYTLKPKHEVIPDHCSYKLNSSTLELKLRKAINKNWDTLTVTNENLEEGTTVNKNTWVPASKTEVGKHSNIPPAPPVPSTFHESKKPTSLVSPITKGSSQFVSNFPSTLGAEGLTSNNSYPHGMIGLDNIGNTCFMNSVLQCLINTRELRDYFIESNFQQDLNKDNPLGMGGKLAVSFAVLMKTLWSRSVKSCAPTKLKSMMSLKANQFSGFAQHDAQEFMVELLDGLHEDLNRIKKKPYIAEPPDLDGYTDEEAAEESWKLHKMRNDSIIDDLFKGQFRSTLRCHECDKVSVKFDEFCCLSVPIPKDQKILKVVFFWRSSGKKPKKFQVRVSAEAYIDELKQQLASRTGVPSNAMEILEASKCKIHKIFGKGTSLSSLSASDVLMAFEVLTEQQAGEPIVELAITQRIMYPNMPSSCASCTHLPAPNSKLKRCTKCYKVGYCDTNCQKSHWSSHKQHCKLVPEPVGAPFILSIEESKATYGNLSKLAENYARYSVDIFQPPVVQTQVARRRRGSTSSGDVSSEGEEMDVDSEGSAGGAAMSSEREGGAYSGEDRAESDWPLKGTTSSGHAHERRSRQRRSSSNSSNSSEEIPLLSCSPKVKIVTQQKTLTTTAARLFTLHPVTSRAQSLPSPAGDALTDKGVVPLDLKDTQFLAMEWCTNERLPVYCFIQDKEIECDFEEEENVQRNKNTTIEACIDLFTQPENLSEGDSWRCPRCKKPVEATKQMSIWRLPKILIIQLKRFSFKYVLYSDKIDKFVQYPTRSLDVGPFMSENSSDSPAIYDLYGVINHMGRLLGGHYTAYCRTVDEKDSRESEIDWRLCDDSRVYMVNESRVVHEQAYLLCYRRRNDPFIITRPSLFKGEEEDSDEEEVFDSQQEPMETATPMSMSSVSQVSSSGSDPPSTVQEELD